jgi:hypothetical protein
VTCVIPSTGAPFRVGRGWVGGWRWGGVVGQHALPTIWSGGKTLPTILVGGKYLPASPMAGNATCHLFHYSWQSSFEGLFFTMVMCRVIFVKNASTSLRFFLLAYLVLQVVPVCCWTAAAQQPHAAHLCFLAAGRRSTLTPLPIGNAGANPASKSLFR